MTRSPQWRTTGARIRVGQVHGLDTVTLENGSVRVSVAPGKGCEIIEFVDKLSDTDYCSYAAEGPVGVDRTISQAPSAAGAFHDHYTGGWQQIFPSGGMPTEYRGAALGQHGEASIRPWTYDIVADDEGEVTVCFDTSLVRLPFTLTRTMRLTADSPQLMIKESATNLAPVEMEAMWGQHITLGSPFLAAGRTITLPDGVIVLPHQGHGFDSVERDIDQTWPVVT